MYATKLKENSNITGLSDRVRAYFDTFHLTTLKSADVGGRIIHDVRVQPVPSCADRESAFASMSRTDVPTNANYNIHLTIQAKLYAN